jgi:hypothetical protein
MASGRNNFSRTKFTNHGIIREDLSLTLYRSGSSRRTEVKLVTKLLLSCKSFPLTETKCLCGTNTITVYPPNFTRSEVTAH